MNNLLLHKKLLRDKYILKWEKYEATEYADDLNFFTLI